MHDARVLAATLDAIVVTRPHPTVAAPQHLCLDKGYDNPMARQAVAERGYVVHIRRISEERMGTTKQRQYSARRWVVERTLAWLSKCRGILIRYEKYARNYLGLIKLACVLLWYRRRWRLSILR